MFPFFGGINGDDPCPTHDQESAGRLDDREYAHVYEPKPVTCKRCGENGLRWVQIDGNWRLFKKNQRHKCC